MFSTAASTKIIILENEISQRIKQATRLPRKSIESKLAWEHVDELRKKLYSIKESQPKPDVNCDIDQLACREYDV